MIDLGPLIETAVSAAGSMGDDVRIAILDFIQQQTTLEVMMCESKMGQLAIGFEAPRNIPIHRTEVYDQIQTAKAQQGTA